MIEVNSTDYSYEGLLVNSLTLRQLWSVVEETQTNTLLKFSDAELIQQLLKQLEKKSLLSSEEVGTMSN